MFEFQSVQLHLKFLNTLLFLYKFFLESANLTGRFGPNFLHLIFQVSQLFISWTYLPLKFFVCSLKIFFFNWFAQLCDQFIPSFNLCLHGLNVFAVGKVLWWSLTFFSCQFSLQGLYFVFEVCFWFERGLFGHQFLHFHLYFIEIHGLVAQKLT